MAEDFSDIDRRGIISIAGDDRSARKTITISACRLPPKTEIDYEKFLRYIKHKLDRYVKTSSDPYVEKSYSVVYFHHGLKNTPSLFWIRDVHQALDRDYKKNLKALFIVHPSWSIKIVWSFLETFLSEKSAAKVIYIDRLADLEEYFYTEELDIPDDVKSHDKGLSKRNTVSNPSASQFGVSLNSMKLNTGKDIPPVVKKVIVFLKKYGLTVEGLFRRSGNAARVKGFSEKFNKGKVVEFSKERDIHVASEMLKKFLRELPRPLLTYRLYDDVIRIYGLREEDRLKEVKEVLRNFLPSPNFVVLKYVMVFLSEVVSHSGENKMNSDNLATVIGPNLIWDVSPAASLDATKAINSITKIIIENVSKIFD